MTNNPITHLRNILGRSQAECAELAGWNSRQDWQFKEKTWPGTYNMTSEYRKKTVDSLAYGLDLEPWELLLYCWAWEYSQSIGEVYVTIATIFREHDLLDRVLKEQKNEH